MVEKILYRDVTQPVEARIDDLLERMSIDEKIAQLAGVWGMSLIDSEKRFSESAAETHIPHGIGHITRAAASTLLQPNEIASFANAIQRFLTEKTRLSIPAIVHEESCAGFLARGATAFPQAIGMAAMWEPELVEAIAKVIQAEMKAVGAHHSLAPVLDVTRDPRWGRLEETFGEDPYLITRTGIAYIKGLQGENLSGIVATGKHFIGYGMPEGGMNWAPAHIPEREMREIFMTPFKAAIEEAQIASMMNAYHEMDGVPCGSSKELMVDLLRGELGFDGVVVSDYFTVHQLMEYHHVAADKETAAKMALEAGIDIELPAIDCYGEPLRAGLEAGRIDINLIDQSVRRVLKMKFQLGLFENPYVPEGQAAALYNTETSRELSRDAARKSLVLLKNDHDLLPLKKSLSSIAVIGPSADSIRLLQGDYHYPSHLEILFDFSEASSDAPSPESALPPVDDPAAHFNPTITVRQGIEQTVSPETQIYYARGCDILDTDTSGFAEAVEAASKAEVAIVVVGERSGLVTGCTSGESIDRAELGLIGVQQQLIEAVQATGTPTVVVLISGRPLALPWVAEHIPALLVGWLPAQEGGGAIADVLFGDYAPSGKLPVSFPRSVGQIPVYYNHKPSGGRSHWKGEYIDLSPTPLYPFGHGLSYTTFEYTNLRLSHTKASAADTIDIQVDIRNSGTHAGDEVVQLYLHDIVASVTRPVKELKGFKRLSLQAGEQKTVTFQLAIAHLGFYNREMAFVVEPGTIEVLIGSSSEDIRLQAEFEITGEITPVKQVFNTPVYVE